MAIIEKKQIKTNGFYKDNVVEVILPNGKKGLVSVVDAEKMNLKQVKESK